MPTLLGASSVQLLFIRFIFLPPYCLFFWLLEFVCSVLLVEASAIENWCTPISIISYPKNWNVSGLSCLNFRRELELFLIMDLRMILKRQSVKYQCDTETSSQIFCASFSFPDTSGLQLVPSRKFQHWNPSVRKCWFGTGRLKGIWSMSLPLHQSFMITRIICDS